MRFSVCSIEPEGSQFAHFLYDICRYICYGIESAGYDCCIVRNQLYSDRINIIIGTHNLNNPAAVEQIRNAGKYILLQTEIITGDSVNFWGNKKAFSEVYLPLMRQAATVWTGIESNIGQLKQLGIHSELIRLGYHPNMDEVIHKKNKDIDFLYFGSLTDHRKKMVEEVVARGGKVVTMFDDAAMFRNDLIARTRVNLAPHQGPGRNHFTSKILHLINNRSVVAVERCCDQEMFEHCFPSADTEHWADLCMETLGRPDLLEAAKEYYERFKQICMVDLIKPLIEKLKLSISSPLKNREQAKSTLKDEKAASFLPGMTSIIIMPSADRAFFAGCVETVTKNTPQPHELICIRPLNDKVSNNFQKQLAKTMPVTWINAEAEKGITHNLNKAVSVAAGEYIVMLRDDIMVTEGWLVALVDRCTQHRKVGVLAPIIGNFGGRQGIDHEFLDQPIIADFARRFRERNRHREIWLRNLAGICMFFRKELFQAVNGFDSELEDSKFVEDFCLRVELAGYRNVIAGDVYVHHYGNAASGSNTVADPILGGSRKKLDEKWTGVDVKIPPGRELLPLRIIEEAQEEFAKDRTEEAVNIMLKGIKTCPEVRSLYHTLAEMLIEGKQHQNALEILGQLPHDPEDLKLVALQGYCHEGLGQLDLAEISADQVLGLIRNDASALNLKGIIEHKKGDKGRAESIFKRAIDSSPSYGEPYTNLGVMQWAAGKREEGLELLERGFILTPTVQEIATLYHSAVTEKGLFERAEEVFREARAAYPLNLRIVYLLIDILLKEQKYHQAMGIIEDALVVFGVDGSILAAATAVRDKIGERVIDPALKKKMTLSLCMIVKNEEKYLAQCLNSVKIIVDEMVIVDTGSSDRTKEIARIFGARLFEIPWQDDFASARNISLENAKGDWILVLDGDEVLAKRDTDRLRGYAKKTGSKPIAYNIDTRNYTRNVAAHWVANDGTYEEEAGSGWFPSTKVRLFPNDKRIRFVNPVHELVEPTLARAGYQIKECVVPIHHYGKLDQKKAEDKGEAYFLLGMEKLKDDENNAKAIYELAIQATELNRHEDAIDLWNRLIKLRPEIDDAYINVVKPYAELGRLDEALAMAKKGYALAPKKREAVYHYALCEFALGNYPEVIRLIETYLSSDPDYPPMLALLSSVYILSNRGEEGFAMIDRLGRMGFNYTEQACLEATKLASLDRKEDACALLRTLIERKIVNHEMAALYEEYRCSS